MKIIITLSITVSIIMAIAGLRISDTDIQNCVNASNYSVERCKVELAR